MAPMYKQPKKIPSSIEKNKKSRDQEKKVESFSWSCNSVTNVCEKKWFNASLVFKFNSHCFNFIYFFQIEHKLRVSFFS